MLTTAVETGRTEPYQIIAREAGAPRPRPPMVEREDPRYYDLRWFAAPDEGQSWVQARHEQVEAIEARKAEERQLQQQAVARPHASLGQTFPDPIPFCAATSPAPDHETIPLSDNSPRRGRWPEPQPPHENKHHGLAGLASGLRQAFPSLIPEKPYCANILSDGLQIREKKSALEKRHIQLNGPATFRWMPHDIDHAGAYYAHRDANLPEPNVIAINPENGRGHSAILLATPVARHSAARVEPLRFYGAIERGIARRIGADRHYSGLIVKNPVHRHWRVEWRREQPYTLHELADWLFFEDMRPDPTVETTLGVGRNCTVFDELRAIAYREVREYKRSGSVDMFQARLEHVALGINLQFPQALKLGEVRAIAKSVARWTWRHFDDEKFRARQSFLGKRANAKRWAGHVSSEKARPWVTEGISRATWYRRRAKP
jgi:hypothetical protein